MVTTRVLAPLSDRTFLTLAEMNDAVAAKCRALNDAPMIREAVSRSQLFAEERPMLRPLPAQAWQWVTWTSRVVASDCHIQLETCFYSVPHFWCEQRVRVRLGAKTVEIFPPKPVQRAKDPDPIAVHPRLFGRNRHATVELPIPTLVHEPRRYGTNAVDRQPGLGYSAGLVAIRSADQRA